jgi:hypothetical protein
MDDSHLILILQVGLLGFFVLAPMPKSLLLMTSRIFFIFSRTHKKKSFGVVSFQ